MPTATMTTKGQITIPAAVRASLGLDTGSRIEFVEIEKGKFAIVPATGSVLALKGLLRRNARPVSIAQMNEAIAMRGSGMAGRGMAGRGMAKRGMPRPGAR